MDSISVIIITAVIAAVVFGVCGFYFGIRHRKNTAELAIGSAEDECKRMLNDAIKQSEAKKKEAILEAKEEILRIKTENDNDLKERRNEVKQQERRINQKEEQLDKKFDNFEKKEEKLVQKLKDVETKLVEVDDIKRSQLGMLEKISGLTVEQAKSELLNDLDAELIHEKAVKINDYKHQLKDEVDTEARKLIAQAIQRVAADHSSECTVSVVALPNDEMKGRIIGREGRNIRTLETLTGCDLIIDDTPEAITVSCFDPIRREIARTALERLITDGRIHPTRIEEMVEKAKNDINLIIKQEGERAILNTGVHGVHPDIVKLLGRLHYRTSFGQNVLNHSVEVSHLAGILAAELGDDIGTAKRAGLLHDIGKALDHEHEGSHISLGVEFCKRYKESEAVLHAIEAHHGEVECKTILAYIIQATDAISAARPGARRENLQNYIKRLEKLEEIATSFAGVERSFAIQAGREIRVLVRPEAVSDDQMVITARDIVKRIEDELEYPGQIKVQVVRESRVSSYAK